ncbi:L-aspartate/L-glutamate decarboxylase [Candidatus Lokiarchaeum ossiferum]|uniref:L-aspartate/L-glutamate decarboxylase n=1 Tax=Candidatus Lokiarchaeum ossiferum TaxID=2951803 RepID=A0ABY6HVE0_9ARCH|nr:L-aspartate/L-glutamate decarboxylase [Candidatus Lokiarchaeum sp. B-35]
MEMSEKGRSIFEILNNIDSFFPKKLYQPDGFANNGKNQGEIIDQLDNLLKSDLSYSSGKILGAMTTEPHEFAKLVYAKYMNRNLGDRGINPGTAEIEHKTISLLGNLLGDNNIQGNMTSGGTEANLIAMYLAKRSKPYVKNPSIVIPESAHYSFDKAAALMGLQLRRARLQQDYELDLNHYESLIDENTVGLVGIAGTSSLGLVDPIDKISQFARDYQIYLHVDAAFGGLVLPFMEKFGYYYPTFDFRNPEVCSMTVDPHKMGMGVNPSGAILVRNSNTIHSKFEIPYLAGGSFKSFNILGTRPGAPAIAFWALLQFLGKDGFIKITKSCWENTLYLANQITQIPEVKIATTPQMNVLGLKLTSKASINFDQFDSRLRAKGWALGKFSQWDVMRVVMMPHVKRDHLKSFISDLKAIF